MRGAAATQWPLIFTEVIVLFVLLLAGAANAFLRYQGNRIGDRRRTRLERAAANLSLAR